MCGFALGTEPMTFQLLEVAVALAGFIPLLLRRVQPPLPLVLNVIVEHAVALRAHLDRGSSTQRTYGAAPHLRILALNSQSTHGAWTEIHTFFALDDIVLAINLSR